MFIFVDGLAPGLSHEEEVLELPGISPPNLQSSIIIEVTIIKGNYSAMTCHSSFKGFNSSGIRNVHKQIRRPVVGGLRNKLDVSVLRA